jgi:ELWxxDGT repeat protein
MQTDRPVAHPLRRACRDRVVVLVAAWLWATLPAQAQPAYRVKDIRPAPAQQSSPMFLTSIGATLYFTADDGVHGRELWRSDGTEAGTVMVKEIAAGAPSSDPLYLANANGTLYLVADDGMNGSSLWKSDGTAAGTARLSSAILGVIPVDYGQGLAAALYFGGSTYFFGQDAGGRALFKTDGTEAGTVRITAVGSLESVKSAAEVDGLLFFNDGDQLWKTDGTAAGTTLVLDLRPVLGSPSLFELTDVAGTLFFRGSDGASGEELWRSDGTSAGTVMVKDINPGGGGAALNDLKNVNGTLFFRADDGVHGREPWESDGTDAGTVMIRDINPGAAHSLGSPSFQAVNGAVYFVVASGGASGSGFWKTDGTPAGTVLVKQVVIQSSLFTAQDKIYFAGDDSGINGYELWRSDGTAAGTAMLQNIAPGAASSLPSPFVPAGSLLFFAASDDATATNRELWALATASPPPLDFFTLSPCRLIDTRNPAGPLGGPALVAGADRSFTLAGNCELPLTAKAVSVNVAVTGPTAAGNLRLFPAGTPLPTVSALNYAAGQTRGNNAIIGLSPSGEVTIRCAQASGTVHVIVDVNGYFKNSTDACALLNPPDGPPASCSITGTEPASITFVNACATESVEVWWVDYACGEQFFRTLAPDESYTQQSFVTHPWRIRELGSHRLLKEVPAPVVPGNTIVTVP